MIRRIVPPLVMALALTASAPPLYAQGKSGEKGKQAEARGQPKERGNQGRGQGAQKQDKRGNADNHRKQDNRGQADNRGKAASDHVSRGNAGDNDRTFGRRSPGRFARDFAVDDVHPKLRRYAASDRMPERIAAGALSRALARGLGDDDVVIRQNGSRISLFNDDGIVLVDLDEERARNLGGWRVDPWDDEVRDGAPSFCRSGAGHPVFGRDWCLDKGFGLGDYRDLRWGRAVDIGDIIFQREIDRGTLARAMLVDVLGDLVFNRLGLHAITLGYNDPLTGVWLGEPTGPQVLRITSGEVPIAEIYDDDRDRRADALVIALRPW